MGFNKRHEIEGREHPDLPIEDHLWDGDPDVIDITSMRGPWTERMRGRGQDNQSEKPQGPAHKN